MSVFLTALTFLRRVPWQVWAAAAVAIGVLWFGHARYEAGQASIQALWAADRAAMKAAADKAISDAEARAAMALANNTRLKADADAQMDAIAADRDTVAGLLKQARDQIRSLTARASTDQLILADAARIARLSAEVDRRLESYDAACRRDAVRFQALQDELRPQL